METTWERAEGKWPAILAALGIPAKILDGKHHPCPIPGCGGKDRFRFIDDNKGHYICGQCGAGLGFKLLKRFHGWDFKTAAREVNKIVGNLPPSKSRTSLPALKSSDIAKLWRTTNKIQDEGPAARYLIARGISMAAWPKHLRFAWWTHKPTDQKLPCMVALFRNAEGELGTLHRTYLADVKPRRMFLKTGVPKGGAIRLFDADLCMGIAEGIETALSAALLFRMPVWACCSEALLRAWQPPPGVKRITVFGDNDSSFVGQRAAYELAWRLSHDGYHVTVKIPPTPDTDWNDALKEQQPDSDLSQLWLFDRRERSTGQSLSAT
jgi:putative DNA primase/helicase